MIERLNGRTVLGLAAAGLLLVLLVGWFGAVSPQRSKAAELGTKIGRRGLGARDHAGPDRRPDPPPEHGGS